MAQASTRIPLPLWSWAYVVFRFADGATSTLVALSVILHYGLPLWAMAVATACMNLAGVPGSFLWGKLMGRVRDPRPFVVVGFAMAGLSMVGLAMMPAFGWFLVAAAGFTAFGIATSPASSLLVLQGSPREQWSNRTSRLSRRTGLAFLLGMCFTIIDGFGGDLVFQAHFALAATLCFGASILAAQTLGARPMPLPHEADFDAGVVQAGARRFERPVYMPGRIRYLPSLRGMREGLFASHRIWPLGVALAFAGSVCFFTSYSGILSRELGLATGLVLLCNFPSNLVSPLAYPWAARFGSRVGEGKAVAHGATIRLLALPAIALVIVFAGPLAVPLLLLLHGLFGFSFALIQVNTPLLMAELHPGGRGEGVGTHHAAMGMGTLLGSAASFLWLRLAPYWASYIFAVALGTAGCLLLVRAHGQRERQTAVPQAP